MNAATILEDAARALPAKLAVIDREAQYTYRELDALANRVANKRHRGWRATEVRLDPSATGVSIRHTGYGMMTSRGCWYEGCTTLRWASAGYCWYEPRRDHHYCRVLGCTERREPMKITNKDLTPAPSGDTACEENRE